MNPETKRTLVLASVFVVVFVVVKSLITWVLDGRGAAVAEVPYAIVGALLGALVFAAVLRWKGR